MTDPDAVLNRIDDLLDGVDEDWTISGDAMRWAPPEEPNEPCACTVAQPCDQHIPLPPDSFADEMARRGESFAEAIGAALELVRRLDTLTAIVPDQSERDLYWAAAGGDLDRAIELAQSGRKPEVPEPSPNKPTGQVPRLPRLNLRIVHDRPSRSTT